jgi:hypothetical protein
MTGPTGRSNPFSLLPDGPATPTAPALPSGGPAGRSNLFGLAKGDCVSPITVGPSGRSTIFRLVPNGEPWEIYAVGCGNPPVGWPSEPRWGLAGEPSWGWGGPERVQHWSRDPLQDVFASSVIGAPDAWFPQTPAWPWIGGPSWPDDPYSVPPLFILDVQEDKASVDMAIYAWLGWCDWTDQVGTTWFGLMRNGLLITSDTNSTSSASLLYSGAIYAGERWIVLYDTFGWASNPEGGFTQGVEAHLWVP